MANVAQGGAALAVYFKTKNEKLKQVAIPAATSCLLGITEAAIFGVNLRLIKPFVFAAIGGALAGGYVVLSKVAMTAVGVTGIPGLAIVQQGSMVQYIVGLIIAFGFAFAATFFFGVKEEEEDVIKNAELKSATLEPTVDVSETEVLFETITSPMKGKLINLEEVPDKTFADKFLGDGVAIVPEDGLVTSPVDGEVLLVFETKHAVAVKSDSGLEILIHIGLDTVKLQGEGFTSFVKKGDRVKCGDKLMEVDLTVIEEQDKSTITPIVVTNMDKVASVSRVDNQEVNNNENMLSVGIK
jgi:PTS system beta-glucosides-specific IIC component/PTS system sucrose-specific IIC component